MATQTLVSSLKKVTGKIFYCKVCTQIWRTLQYSLQGTKSGQHRFPHISSILTYHVFWPHFRRTCASATDTSLIVTTFIARIHVTSCLRGVPDVARCEVACVMGIVRTWDKGGLKYQNMRTVSITTSLYKCWHNFPPNISIPENKSYMTPKMFSLSETYPCNRIHNCTLYKQYKVTLRVDSCMSNPTKISSFYMSS
jgi:hypothetical protein